ncbi:MAG TPA: Gfo/Idh/MocA family oxidoreductase, partial [Sediminibacterium sp.]|nr:Gfo/Idh/MocA family oxidoreductase [Sediminibacterium sp.]
ATPPDVHEAYAIAALKAGKQVYVEKPMSITVASCLRMQEAAAYYHGKLVIAHYRRALPMFRCIQDLLLNGRIGKPRSVRISLLLPDASQTVANSETNWRTSPAISGGGILYDLAPHQLDLLVHFFGNPLGSFGFSANQAALYKAEDVVCGIAHLPGPLLFSGQWCFTVAQKQAEDVFEITGSEGRIRFAVFGHNVTIETAQGTETLSFTPPKHIQQPMIERVVQYFQGLGPNPCSPADAIPSMQMIETFAYSNRFI